MIGILRQQLIRPTPQVFSERKAPPTSYYISWAKWLPVMKNYEAGTPSYFATPPVQLIYALHQSLKNITTAKPSLEERFAMHREASNKFKAFVTELGMGQVRGAREV